MLPEFQLGKLGVEARLEERLRGKAGTRRVEVNSAGREMRELERIEGQQGETVQSTLDAALQNFAVQRLGEESAAAVVIDVQNGDILASASAPTFDPNLFVRGISGPDYRALMEHDHRPLADKTVQEHTGPNGGPVQVQTIPLPVFGPNDPLNHFDQAAQEEPDTSGDDDPGE